jgi:hypothetical protein
MFEVDPPEPPPFVAHITDDSYATTTTQFAVTMAWAHVA